MDPRLAMRTKRTTRRFVPEWRSSKSGMAVPAMFLREDHRRDADATSKIQRHSSQPSLCILICGNPVNLRFNFLKYP